MSSFRRSERVPHWLVISVVVTVGMGCAANDVDSVAAPDALVGQDDIDGAAQSYFERCGIEERYGGLGRLEGSALRQWPVDDPNQPTTWMGIVEYVALPQREVNLIVALQPDRGYFADGIGTGTFLIKGSEAIPEMCSVCVHARSYLRNSEDNDMRCYFARGGTVTISSIEDRLIGSVSDIRFSARSCDVPSDPLDDGCETAIDSASFNAAIGTTLEGE